MFRRAHDALAVAAPGPLVSGWAARPSQPRGSRYLATYRRKQPMETTNGFTRGEIEQERLRLIVSAFMERSQLIADWPARDKRAP